MTLSSMSLENGTIQIGSDMPYRPFEFETARDQPTGFDVELMNAIAQVGSWLVFIDGGVIAEKGKPKDVFADPHSERLRSFLSKVL
jgi:ABC-type amino acid transport substrate-binding protein